MEKEYVCLSTHGGSGYATGSYWDSGAVICGWCGTRIENPYPTSEDEEYYYYGKSIRVPKEGHK